MGRASKPVTHSVHPGAEAVRHWVATLKTATRRALDEWVALVRAEGPPDETARRAWLVAEHGLGPDGARWIAERCEPAADPCAPPYLKEADEWVEEMYSGKKAALRPVHDALVRAALGLGSDVSARPCKTVVPLYRRHVFAQIKPTANTRIDLGFALRGAESSARLVDTGGSSRKDPITHRVAVARVEEIDAELLGWLKAAYDLDAGDDLDEPDA